MKILLFLLFSLSLSAQPGVDWLGYKTYSPEGKQEGFGNMINLSYATIHMTESHNWYLELTYGRTIGKTNRDHLADIAYDIALWRAGIGGLWYLPNDDYFIWKLDFGTLGGNYIFGSTLQLLSDVGKHYLGVQVSGMVTRMVSRPDGNLLLGVGLTFKL